MWGTVPKRVSNQVAESCGNRLRKAPVDQGFAELAPTGTESEPPESTTAYQVILNAASTGDGLDAALRGLESARPPAATPA